MHVAWPNPPSVKPGILGGRTTRAILRGSSGVVTHRQAECGVLGMHIAWGMVDTSLLFTRDPLVTI
jgi:hypothetical protein